MTRRDFLHSLTALAAAPAQPPNVVVILADDLGYGDVSYQNPESKISTPHIDRLAKEGIRFTDAHTPSAVCTPTRYGLLTGRYCWRSSLKSGVLWGDSPNLIEPGRLTLASLLKGRGYRTGAVGKWHLGLGSGPKTDFGKPLRPGPLDHGFDFFFGIPASLDMPPYLYVENDRPVEPATGYTEGRRQGGIFWREGPKAPGFEFEQVLATLTAKAVGFIRNSAASRQPFFLYFALTSPHTPWVPRPQFRGRSRAGTYGDFVCETDWAVGQVLEELERSGVAQRTLVVFTSDNGPERYVYDLIPEFQHYSMASWRGVKRDAWEGGHRVPFLARWPARIPAGAVSSEVICLTDLMATLASICGTALPQDAGEDSYDISPALFGKPLTKPIREATVHHTAGGRFAIRQGDWVYIDAPTGMETPEPEWFRRQRGVVPHQEPAELFNLREDPAERRNRYPERRDIAAALKALLEKYKAQGRSAPTRS